MKTQIKVLALFILITSGIMMKPERATADHFGISFQVFYNELSPYGNWVYLPEYGYAWVPDVPAGFFPYATHGHWVYTYAGWTWVSDYPWGWAPFHYGRWHFDDYYGAMWIPGYEWAPAWVIWRSSGDYCGWAPMGPGITIEIAFGRNYFVPHRHWRFVRYYDFGRPDIYRHYVHHDHNITIINHTTIINNIYEDHHNGGRYMAGPQRHEVERRTGRDIHPVTIKERSTPGQRLAANEVELYRPKAERTFRQSNAPAPEFAENRGTYERGLPAKSEYGKQMPAKAEPVRKDYGKQMPAKVESVRKDYGKQMPAKAEPVRKDYGKQMPAKAEPVRKTTSPAKAQSVKPAEKVQNHGGGGSKTEAVKAPAKTNPAAGQAKKSGK